MLDSLVCSDFACLTLRVLINWTGSLFVAVTYLLIPEKRKNVAIYYALATAVFDLSFVFASWFHPRKIWYEEKSRQTKSNLV
jgi:hypothetical protein